MLSQGSLTVEEKKWLWEFILQNDYDNNIHNNEKEGNTWNDGGGLLSNFLLANGQTSAVFELQLK